MKQLITILLLTSLLISCKKSSDEDEYSTLTATVIDFDTNTAIEGAKVFSRLFGVLAPVDSAVSDVNGRVSFTFKKEGPFRSLHGQSKQGYLNPYVYIPAFYDHGDTTVILYLAKPSFINVTIHKTGTYLPSDTVDIQVSGANTPIYGQSYNYVPMHRDKADAPDKLFNLQTVFGHNNGVIFLGTLKVYFRADIIRNALVVSTKTDSTNLIQFGTQNFSFNY